MIKKILVIIPEQRFIIRNYYLIKRIIMQHFMVYTMLSDSKLFIYFIFWTRSPSPVFFLRARIV